MGTSTETNDPQWLLDYSEALKELSKTDPSGLAEYERSKIATQNHRKERDFWESGKIDNPPFIRMQPRKNEGRRCEQCKFMRPAMAGNVYVACHIVPGEIKMVFADSTCDDYKSRWK